MNYFNICMSLYFQISIAIYAFLVFVIILLLIIMTHNHHKTIKNQRKQTKETSNFLFNLNHDVRSSINTIIGYTNVGKNHIKDSTKVNDSFDKISKSSTHLLNVINDVLEIGRIESGKLSLNDEQHNIYQLLEASISYGDSVAKEKGMQFSFNVSNIKDKYIFCDELHLNEILINVLYNAVKNTPKGGQIDYFVKQVSDSINGYAKYQFQIRDSGKGYSNEELKHLFDAYSQDKSPTISNNGQGLGLSVANSLVNLYNGKIKVDTEVGCGTTFNITLPFKVMNKKQIEAFKEMNATNDQLDEKSLEGRKVLLVDDDDFNREIALDILQVANLIVDEATDGESAVGKVMEKGINYYDYILMDVQMPVMNGLEATKTIRSLVDGDKPIIIALSANAFNEDIKMSLDAGMNAHISKPLHIQELLDCMKNLKK